MNRRLLQIYQMIPKNSRGVIDVGTDHGKIPVQLALDHYSGNIFATDIATGPLSGGKKYAEQNHVLGDINFILCDGLENCPYDLFDTIVIAGMGGDTICRILDQAEWLFSSRYCLILQPMRKAEVLRYWLLHNEYSIDLESAISEDSHVYQIFRAVPGTSSHLQDYEYLIGDHHSERCGDSVQLLIKQQMLSIQKKLNGSIETSADNAAYSFYKTIYEQLKTAASCKNAFER